MLTLGAFKVRRGVSVALVYLTFAAALLVILLALGTVVVSQTKTAAERFNAYFTAPHGQTHLTSADRDVNRLQTWLDRHHLRSIKIEQSGHRFVERIRQRDVGRYTHRIVNFVEGAAISIGKALFDGVLVLVVSIYMLLDMQRLARVVDRRFPPHGGRPLISRMEHALVSYVRGQILLSLIIGASAGIGLWILGVTGLLPGADNYALLFGALGRVHRGAARTSARGSARSRRRSTRSSCIRSRWSGSCCSSSGSIRSRATSSCRR